MVREDDEEGNVCSGRGSVAVGTVSGVTIDNSRHRRRRRGRHLDSCSNSGVQKEKKKSSRLCASCVCSCSLTVCLLWAKASNLYL